MPMQKRIPADPTNADHIIFLHKVSSALIQDGWGCTIIGNPDSLELITNAPSNILEPYLRKYAHHIEV